MVIFEVVVIIVAPFLQVVLMKTEKSGWCSPETRSGLYVGACGKTSHPTLEFARKSSSRYEGASSERCRAPDAPCGTCRPVLSAVDLESYCRVVGQQFEMVDSMNSSADAQLLKDFTSHERVWHSTQVYQARLRA